MLLILNSLQHFLKHRRQFHFKTFCSAFINANYDNPLFNLSIPNESWRRRLFSFSFCSLPSSLISYFLIPFTSLHPCFFPCCSFLPTAFSPTSRILSSLFLTLFLLRNLFPLCFLVVVVFFFFFSSSSLFSFLFLLFI